MTVEEFLNMTNEEEQYLMSIGYGELITNPFYPSLIGRPADDDSDDEDESLDIPDDSYLDNQFGIPNEEDL